MKCSNMMDKYLHFSIPKAKNIHYNIAMGSVRDMVPTIRFNINFLKPNNESKSKRYNQ